MVLPRRAFRHHKCLLVRIDKTSDRIDIWDGNRPPAQNCIQRLPEIPLRWRRPSLAEINIPVVDAAEINQLASPFQYRDLRGDSCPDFVHQIMRSEEHTSELQSLRHLVC